MSRVRGGSRGGAGLTSPLLAGSLLPTIYEVSEVAERIAGLLEHDPVLHDVWLRGEVTNLTRSAAGHFYFSLKDGVAQLRCVLFRGNAARSPATPASGMAGVVHGAIRFYPPHGTCEVIADLVFPEGVGLAEMQFQALYRRLEAEGLFDPGRKRSLPRFPRRIGVVSSATGAVIQDLLTVLRRRYPLAEVVFAPAAVQGAQAVPQMVEALAALDAWRDSQDGRGLDVLVVARGGGSAEDLAAFNDERLVRAIYACRCPTVSAVGHETDVTLADLVADVRAPTPSAAAEMIAPDLRDVLREVASLGARGATVVEARLESARAASERARATLASLTRQRLRVAEAHLAGRRLQLEALSPLATLRRGYAVAEIEGVALRDAAAAGPGQPLTVRLHRGRLEATLDAVLPDETEALP